MLDQSLRGDSERTRGQRGGPCLGRGLRRSARDGLGNFRVPDGVEVGVLAVVDDIDTIAAGLEVLAVQRLADVADEVNDHLGGNLTISRAELGVCHARGVVGNGAHDAAILAVTVQIHAARRRRVVLSINVVVARGKLAGRGVLQRP